jgi:hypothetical protein
MDRVAWSGRLPPGGAGFCPLPVALLPVLSFRPPYPQVRFAFAQQMRHFDWRKVVRRGILAQTIVDLALTCA